MAFSEIIRQIPATAKLGIIVFTLITAHAEIAAACDGACFQKLSQENEAISTLAEYKDSEETLRLKIAHMEIIQNRVKRETLSSSDFIYASGIVVDVK